MNSRRSGSQREFDDLVVDLISEMNGLLHLLLIVRLGAFSLNILLDAVDSRLVGDQTLLNLVETVVDLVLEDHITAGIVLHRVVSSLLSNTSSIRADLLADRSETNFLILVVSCEIVKAGELVRHLILHALDILAIDLHFFVHTSLEIGDFL